MSKQTVVRILVVYWAIMWIAVAFRIDRFPLSWAPMYSVWKPPQKDVLMVRDVDPERMKTEGFRVTRRDGSEGFVNRRDLNVRGSSMRRMYFRRMRGKGAPKKKERRQMRRLRGDDR